MSGLVKSIGKVFKRVTENKVVKGLAIAAAVYFAGGLAAGAMGSTTAANLPGIKGAADLFGMDGGAFSGAPPGDMPLPSAQATPLATPPPIQETDLTKSPLANAPAAPAATPAAPAPAAAAAPAPAPSAPGAVPGAPPPVQTAPGAPGVPKTAVSWWQGLSPGAQQILAQGFSGGAAGMMQALAAKSAQEDAEKRDERQREDRVRRGSVPDFSAGIINRARGS